MDQNDDKLSQKGVRKMSAVE